MSGIPYPPKNCEIIFREPFFRREWSVNQVKYYIKASINGLPEQEIRIARRQQMDILDYLIKVDLKLTGAIVRCDALGRFTVIRHSPASDFLT